MYYMCVLFVRAERLPILEQYETMWRDYQSTYETFPLAKLLKQKIKEREHAAERCRQAESKLEAVRTQHDAVEASAGVLQVLTHLSDIWNELLMVLNLANSFSSFHTHFDTNFFSKLYFCPQYFVAPLHDDDVDILSTQKYSKNN